MSAQNRQRTENVTEMATSFGFEQVGEGEKQPMVNKVFHQVADRYDIMNDLMSGGMHRIWKDAFVAWLNPPQKQRGTEPFKLLDVAGGTGDISFRVIERSKKTAHSTVFDINGSMLAVGKDRAKANGLIKHLEFVEGNAEELPFEDKSFDAYTIAYGIRNVPRIDKALSEAYRVLKRGGRFMCLEFSNVEMPVLDKVYDAFSFNAIPRIGDFVTGDAESYEYLVESIRKFPNQARFKAMIEKAGFEQVTYRNLSGGITAMHSGWKL
ncbi:bifunctional demethylmenaquinone methyltransferase/2-methoxy-6-polyprenyl-1,4-benzoquinol methylase UbiE [uncultured Cohaesibacter sp.]|uniref:bifunctional demethylmenaquinone methyltransferase/2-methoxy-6-polyprenyl-1,4-benzoquinol methylase UbiE n=1 Tax=uncultured Cohaesibacter sp. TaxID=1002546 RepID=UPI0029C956DD|nr:bifunctional demethylmenaquinone methyltransferase/2-methoxy-6-polyprenyl-1,4-benzoquinol methylase UbiE [uncultured Cohaesibacter sp.]